MLAGARPGPRAAPPSGPRVQTLHFLCGPAGITIETVRVR
jgi:hypothetical protein